MILLRATCLGAALLAASIAAAASADADRIEATFDCADGTVLEVTFDNARNVAIVSTEGMDAQTLPIATSGSGYYYTNGRYGLRGKGDAATWEIGRMAPLDCKARP